jgi:hypothetical protein
VALYKSEMKVILRTCQILFQESLASWAQVTKSDAVEGQGFVLKACQVWFKGFSVSYRKHSTTNVKINGVTRALTFRLPDTSAFTLAASCFLGCQINSEW